MYMYIHMYAYIYDIYVGETCIRTEVSKGKPKKRWMGATKTNMYIWLVLPRIRFCQWIKIQEKYHGPITELEHSK